MSNGALQTRKNRRTRLAGWAGGFCSFVACVSLLVSLGMPGMGWMMAMLALVANSVLVPLSGRRYAIVTLVVSLVHLLTLGPLSLLVQPASARLSIVELMSLVILPIGIALIFIAFSTSLLKKK